MLLCDIILNLDCTDINLSNLLHQSAEVGTVQTFMYEERDLDISWITRTLAQLSDGKVLEQFQDISESSSAETEVAGP